MTVRIIITSFILTLASSVWSATDKSPQTPSSGAANLTKKTSAQAQSEAEKLYQRYQRLYGKMVLAIACVQNPKCIEPEDEVLKYKTALIRITDRLDDLVKQKDLDAAVNIKSALADAIRSGKLTWPSTLVIGKDMGIMDIWGAKNLSDK